jgi:hypothetical protein
MVNSRFSLYTQVSMRILLYVILACLIVSPAVSQSPASLVTRVDVSQVSLDFMTGLVMLPDGRLIVAWQDRPVEQPPLAGPPRLLLRAYSADGGVGDPFVVFRGDGGAARVGATASGELVVAFARATSPARSFDVFVHRYGFRAGPETLQVNTTTLDYQIPFGVGVDQEGGFVVVWTSNGQETTDQANDQGGIYARRFDPAGNPLSQEIHVNTFRQGDQDLPAIAMAALSGNFVIVWQSSEGDGSGKGVFGQRFAADGARLGGQFLVPARVQGDQEQPAIAMDRAGNFIVVWTSPDDVEPTRTAIFAQRFSAGGERVGSELRVSEVVEGWEDSPSVASDPQGNFIVSWNHWPIGVTMGRLYRASGVPVRAPVPITRTPGWLYASVAFGANGTFGAAWTDIVPADGLQHPYAQRFSASPGEEFCLFRRGEFVCDTGRTGGAPEVQFPFGGEVGEIGLLGDVDGDGRADPCVYRDGVFRCDTEHDFGAAETRIRFGQTGDVPLLGDIDGDGRADPCVYRAGAFLCDTAHDGGSPEVAIAFGQPGDIPLLGDINGDGKADPCVYRSGTFLCDTAHDGSVNVTIVFGGQPGDVPLLGDFDGDGRADPCVYRGGQLLCNTRHDGGAAQGTLTFGNGDGAPLLGNLDGL